MIARLEDISAERQATPPSSPHSFGTTEDLGDEEYYRRHLEEQTELYNTLINEGGRPSHPVSLGRDVLQDPGEYREIFSYWKKQSPGIEQWTVFGCQLYAWQKFRKDQQHYRKGDRFPEYVGLMEQNLAKYGFTHSLELSADLKQQNRLNTWIEYLGYEYCLHDIDMTDLEYRQPQYDEAWKEIVNSNLLRPFETGEFLCTAGAAFFHQSEKNKAEEAVNAAKSIVISAQKLITDLQAFSPLERERRQNLREAQSKLDASTEAFALVKRRNHVIYEFVNKVQFSQKTDDGRSMESHWYLKKRTRERSILLQWIQQQIPLIQLEMNLVNKAENDSSRLVLSVQRRFKRGYATQTQGELCSQRQKRGGDGEANLGESHLKSWRHDSEIVVLPLMQPTNSTFVIDARPTPEPVARQPLTKNAFKPIASKKAKARSRPYSATNKDTSVARNVMPRRTLKSKASKEKRISRNHSSLSTVLRRSTRARKAPDRFQ